MLSDGTAYTKYTALTLRAAVCRCLHNLPHSMLPTCIAGLSSARVDVGVGAAQGRPCWHPATIALAMELQASGSAGTQRMASHVRHTPAAW